MAMERILIIDDSPVEARIASKFLIGSGYSTTILHDGREAIATARDWQPDLILLDVVMPKTDGYQICQQLKADPDTKHIAIALYTIRDQFVDYLKGIEAGADDFIIKTPSGEDFIASVNRILEERRNGLSSTEEPPDLTPIQSLVEMQDRRALTQLLENAFSKHVYEGMRVTLGPTATSMLVNRAIERTAARFPFLGRLDQSHGAGELFNSQAIEEVATIELIESFRAFNNDLFHLITKLTRIHVDGAKEARVVERVFTTMAKELRVKYDELRSQASDPARNR